MDDVVGHEQAKKMLTMVLEMVEFPALYEHWNQNDEDAANNCVLLMGEPGNGKTMLAKAIAALGKGTFISTTGFKFVNTYVGMGANNVVSWRRKSTPCQRMNWRYCLSMRLTAFAGSESCSKVGATKIAKTLG